MSHLFILIFDKMGKFIKNIALFFLYFILLLVVAIGAYKFKTGVTLKNMPAPNLTDSYSLNDKLSFVRKKKADVITVGSSMSLNNINSDVIVNKLKTNSYLNLSSWGLSMKDIFMMIKVYTSVHKPSTIILSSNYCDFQVRDKKFDYNEIRDYLTGVKPRMHYFFLNFNLGYHFTNFAYAKWIKSGNNFYESLVYDKYGAVAFNPLNFKINAKRWNNVDHSGLRDAAYDYLDSISNFCRQNKIKLLFFQSPIRGGIYTSLKKDWLFNHISRVKTIILNNGQVFIGSDDRVWPDSLFVDALHFNASGTREFTVYCFNKYTAEMSRQYLSRTTGRTTTAPPLAPPPGDSLVHHKAGHQ
jgi:hypothetical protein